MIIMRWLALLSLLPAVAAGQGVLYRPQAGMAAAPVTMASGHELKTRCSFGTSLDCYPQDAAITRASSTWCEQSDGQYAEATSGNACFGAHGLFVAEARTNYMIDSVDATAWAVSGTPTTAADSTGPFETAFPGGGAYVLGDDDAAVAEFFYAMPLGGTIPLGSTITISFWAKEGSRSSITIQLGCSGGTGTITPDIAITSTWTRYEVTTTCAGNTDTYLRVYPADTPAANTGTVIATGWQVEVSGYATPVCLSGGAVTTCAADVVTVPSAGWPTVQGSVSLVFTPYSDTPATDMGSNSSLIDAGGESDASPGWGIRIASGDQLGTLRRDVGGTLSSTFSAGLTWVAGQSYSIRHDWSGTRGVVYRDQTNVAENSDARAVTTIDTDPGLLQRDQGDRQLNGWIRGLEVRR